MIKIDTTVVKMSSKYYIFYKYYSTKNIACILFFIQYKIP